jgi:hypothetical protein
LGFLRRSGQAASDEQIVETRARLLAFHGA